MTSPHNLPTDMGRVLKRPEQIQAVREKLTSGEETGCALDFQVQSGVMLPESWFVSAVGALIQNAIEAHEGSVNITARDLALTQPLPVQYGQPLAAGRYVAVTVSDAGPGFTDAARARATEPGFTTRPGHRGMGLSSAYGIAVSCKGGIDVQPVVGGGSAVTLYVPAAQ